MEVIDVVAPGCLCYAGCPPLCVIKGAALEAVNNSMVWEYDHAIPAW